MSTRYVPIADVAEIVRRPLSPDPSRSYTFLGVSAGGRGFFKKAPVSGAAIRSGSAFEVRTGDFLYSRLFAWKGSFEIVGKSEEGCVVSGEFPTLRVDVQTLDPRWLRYWLLSDVGLREVDERSAGSTPGSRNRLREDRLLGIRIPLPPIEEQLRAVPRLDSVSGCAEQIGGALQGSRARDVLALLPDLVDGIIGSHTPVFMPLCAVAEFVSDVVHPGDDPSPANRFVGLQHVESHSGRSTGWDALGVLKGRKFRFAPGDVLYGYLRPYLNKVWVADCHGLCSVDQYVLRPRAGTSAELLGYALRGRAVLDAATEMTHSLQLPRLRSGLLGQIDVPVVPPQFVEETVTRLNRVREIVLQVRRLRQQQGAAVEALVPSALNEVFAGIT